MTETNIIERVRRQVFGITQKEMAEILGVSQGTLSKWENGEGEPGLTELQHMRDEAIRRRLPWNDEWLFTGPPETETLSAGEDTLQ